VDESTKIEMFDYVIVRPIYSLLDMLKSSLRISKPIQNYCCQIMRVVVVFLIKSLIHELKSLFKKSLIFSLGIAIVFSYLREGFVNDRVAELFAESLG
jgi:hypothetical protein